MPQPALYAVVHPDCGHVAAAAQDRAGTVRLHSYLAEMGYHRWRVRYLPPGPAQEQALAALISSGPRGCDTCQIDQGRVAALIAAVTMAGGAR